MRSITAPQGVGLGCTQPGRPIALKPVAVPVTRRVGVQHQRTQVRRSAKKQSGSVSVTDEEVSDISQAEANAAAEAASRKMKAIAAKITAARELARRLREEKEAALSNTEDNPEATQVRRRKLQEAEAAARQAAVADSVARGERAAARAAKDEKFKKVQAANKALMELVMELAADQEAAQQRLEELTKKFALEAKREKEKAEAEELERQKEKEEKARAKAEKKKEKDTEGTEEGEEAAQEEEEEEDEEDGVKIPDPTFDSADEIVDAYTALATAKEVVDLEAQAAEAAAQEAEQRAVKLQERAKECSANNQMFFLSASDDLAPVGEDITIYYNRNAGPLPGESSLRLKIGFNKWETIEEFHLQRAEIRENGHDGVGMWWSVTMPLPEDLFKAEFVFIDEQGHVDSNSGNDYQLGLLDAPTETEVLERRIAAVEEFELQRVEAVSAYAALRRAEANEEAAQAGADSRAAAQAKLNEARETAAAAEVAELRGTACANALSSAQPKKEGSFFWAGGAPTAGTDAIIAYNKAKGPLASCTHIAVHVGHDGWHQQEKVVEGMHKITPEEMQMVDLAPGQPGDWHMAKISVPESAMVLDFVVSDRDLRVWDNNDGKDFHTKVEGALSNDDLTASLVQSKAEADAEADRVALQLAEQAGSDKFYMKLNAQLMRQEVQSCFLFTEPMALHAGFTATVNYNPDLTRLRGRPEIWMQGCFNRWSHQERFGPIKMEPVVKGGPGFLSADIAIPQDAEVLDLVFSDSSDVNGGFYDNNNELGYHLPTSGSTGSVYKHKVVHVAVEMAPIAKVGGMGDVVTALARAVIEEGHEAEVILPKYDCIKYDNVENLSEVPGFNFADTRVKVWRGIVEGLSVTFLEPENGFFWVGCIYGRNDDHIRFGFFCEAAVEYLRHHAQGNRPTVIHAHDWQTAPVTWLDRGGAASAFTIHNLNYGADLIGRAMQATDVATTVSPTYAEEISGHPSVAPHLSKMFGVRNGIDPDIWDPATDPLLPEGYDSHDAIAGKNAARRALRQRMGLSPADVPVVGVVTRLTHQKGIHLIKHAAWRTLERGAQFVLLGSAPDPKVQGDFNALAEDLRNQYPDRACLCFAYDEPLSHLIYAGADVLLVPSMFEPCGLTQMIAMRYGTIPVVRKTGGLADTVFDVDHDEERAAEAGIEVNGFNFEGTDPAGIDYALNRALALFFSERETWNQLVTRVMRQDWSWSQPALDYIELYYKACQR